MFSKILSILLLKVVIFNFVEGSKKLSDALTDPEDQKWLAKAVAVGFLNPPETLKSIKITHEGKEVTFEVRSLKSKSDVAALSKTDREVAGDEAKDEDYRVVKNFGFGAWLKVGNVSTMEAFLSISDVPPSLKKAWDGLLNKVEGMGNDCTDYGVLSWFFSKGKYDSTELEKKLFREVVQFYMKKHEGKNGRKGKIGLIASHDIDSGLTAEEVKEKNRYVAYFKSIGFKHLGQDVEHDKDVFAVTFAHLK
ncbi:hypothetical protein DdX_18080 [Ditylenchus destructor]|uniref:Uncharacterized protein n=1 Tax=Ditylenchus destructor TaxID=166010 RepID=A0AAD4MQ75_9BILA|nr:hypothetical protein DdX_18080 [Ditylenchus destructor]